MKHILMLSVVVAAAITFSSTSANASNAGATYELFRKSCAEETRKSTAENVAEAEKTGKKVDASRLNGVIAKYIEEVMTETCVHNKLKNEIKDNPEKICAPNQSRLDCAYSHIRGKTRITTGLSLAQVLLAMAGYLDKENAKDKDVAEIQLGDRLLRMIEEAKPGEFYLSHIKPKNDEEKKELARLKIEDHELFTRTLAKTKELVKENLKSVKIPEGEEAKSAMAKWKTKVIDMLNSRLEKLSEDSSR